MTDVDKSQSSSYELDGILEKQHNLSDGSKDECIMQDNFTRNYLVASNPPM